jgi:hypothetical protein
MKYENKKKTVEKKNLMMNVNEREDTKNWWILNRNLALKKL